jgi:hypothetical protein
MKSFSWQQGFFRGPDSAPAAEKEFPSQPPIGGFEKLCEEQGLNERA